MPDPREVQSMFARIAGRYDLLNRVLSFGIDRRWRARLLAEAGAAGGRSVVDVCCGTGDVALAFARAGERVLGVDFTREMLGRAEEKRARLRTAAPAVVFVHGDALALPLRGASADLCTVAFGIRNVADRRACLREMARVVRPGGRVLVLEFSLPRTRVLGGLYRLYFTRLLPAIGGLVSRDPGAYRYLPRTVLAWPSPESFERELEEAGLVECGHTSLTGGIACLHWGRVAARAGRSP